MTTNPARYGRALLLPLALGLFATSAGAGVIHPTSVDFILPSGEMADLSSPFKDDILLESLTFDGVEYNASAGSFSHASDFKVLTGKDQINAEWGDNDKNDPFTKASLNPKDQESTDAAIQDKALLNAFNSLSLSEISDGEGKADSSFKMLFQQSLAYNTVGGDDRPDIVFFERGLNDWFTVQLIIGGSFENPEYSKELRIDSGDFFDTGLKIDTKEINGAQSMGVGGYDLADFGLIKDQIAYGFLLETVKGQGPDLGGFFLAAENSSKFGNPLVPELQLADNSVPLPGTVWMLLPGLGFLGFIATRRRSNIG